MSTLGKMKKIILGEKTPDRDDPAYQKQREKAENAGRRFASFFRIDKAFGFMQRVAGKYPRLFLAVIFGIVIFCFSLNTVRLVRCTQYRQRPEPQVEQTVTEGWEPLKDAVKDYNDNEYDID